MISFDHIICHDLEQALSREWLETNGIGGFASGTIAGAHTRRYHGLLTAATRPPLGRMLLLSKLEEVLIVGDETFELSANEYFGAIHPHGYKFLSSFSLDPWPVYVYQCGSVKLRKSVFMLHGSNTTVVQYDILSAPNDNTVQLQLRPLIAFRDYHSTTHENSAIRGGFDQQSNLIRLRPYDGVPELYLAHNGARIQPQGYWYRNFYYRVEHERGLDDSEDLFNPLVMDFTLEPSRPAIVIASTDPVSIAQAAAMQERERERRSKVVASVPVKTPLTSQLALAADQFLVSRGTGDTVIAGYPWFTDWGRDTMIALPGLTLFAGRTDIARKILLEFSRHIDQGMLPNCFPDDGGQPTFNSVDTPLWFIEAARAYAGSTGDLETIKAELYPVLTKIIECHLKGSRYGIALTDDGLLNTGDPTVQLTWMDAKIGDWVVTPRTGKAVEIQALWYNALLTVADFARQFDDEERRDRYLSLATKARRTFNQIFWNKESRCLFDVVNNGAPDASIRPNQIFAVSLHHSMLSKDRARAVLQVVERELLTPFGLRTLSPHDPRYVPHYQGSPQQRDAAYHQGTVWPWLLGPFVSAYLRVYGRTRPARERALQLLTPLQGHLNQAGLGQISEIFDGDPPHQPRGCVAQAWSTAGLIRVLMQEIYQAEPARRGRAIRVSGNLLG